MRANSKRSGSMTFSPNYRRSSLWLLVLLILPAPSWAFMLSTPQPLRVSSLNLCYDELLQTHSAAAALDVQPTTDHGGRIERILRFSPDLVLANPFNDPMLMSALRRQGVAVEVLPEPQSLGEVAAFFDQLEGLTNIATPVYPETLPQLFAGQRVLMLQANHYSFGSDTLWDELVEALGGHNVAPGSGLVSVLPEQVLRLQPDIIVVLGHDNFALAARNLLHGALAQLLEARAVEVDADLVGCMGQRLDALVEHLRMRLPTPLPTVSDRQTEPMR